MPESDPTAVTALKRLGVDPTKLGCVMLDVEVPDIYYRNLKSEWAYFSSTLEFVNGYSQGDAHCTLLYGLCLGANSNRDLVDEVMEGWVAPETVQLTRPGVFEANDGVADYGAIVLTPTHNKNVDPDLARLYDANYRLGKLPHVRPFSDYNPHVTIGYVHKRFIDDALTELNMMYIDPLKTKALNYGKV